MKEYTVRITERLECDVVVEANSAREARNMVELNWKNSEYVLGAEAFKGVDFKTLPQNRNRDAR